MFAYVIRDGQILREDTRAEVIFSQCVVLPESALYSDCRGPIKQVEPPSVPRLPLTIELLADVPDRLRELLSFTWMPAFPMFALLYS